jgi:charged multivesicular body protein 1
MGNQPPPKAPPKPLTMDEQIMNMRLTAKRYNMESRKAEKEKEKNIQKARQCLKRGDEEGAKLFAQSAANKDRERLQCIQMSHRIEAIAGNIKSNQNNVQMAKELERVTPFLVQQAQQIPIEEVQKTLDRFQGAMDNMIVGGKIMENAMGKISSDQNTSLNVPLLFSKN